jgi:uncharacterized membrane protein YjgN (DUF898 family)
VTDTSAPWGQATGQPVAAPAQPALVPTRPVYDGKLGELYGLYLRHLTLMVLTLGWSRFWGRTRLRRYLWNHLSILGDRFEYRGRGIELFLGFVLVLLMLAAVGGLMWLVWEFVFHESRCRLGFSTSSISRSSLIGFPLAFVGQYAGLRYRLSRTRWRGIRCGMAGSAWRYGALATLPHLRQLPDRPAADAGGVGQPRAAAHRQRLPRHQRLDFAGSAATSTAATSATTS